MPKAATKPRTATRTRLVAIGNSRGVRIPKALIEQCGFGDTVELSVSGDRLLLSPVRAPRQGWDGAFAEMARRGDDQALLEDVGPSDWDETEWRW